MLKGGLVGRESLPEKRLGVPAAGDPMVSDRRDLGDGLHRVGPDEDRWSRALDRLRGDADAIDPEKLTIERHVVLRPELSDELDPLDQARPPRASVEPKGPEFGVAIAL